MKSKALILLTNPSPPTPELLSALLPRLGYDVLWAANPTEALRHLRFEPVDIFLCDLGCPVSLKASSLAQFHEANPRVPMVMFSPIESDDERQLAQRYGALLYMPFSYLALIETMRRLLEASHKSQRRPSEELQPPVPFH